MKGFMHEISGIGSQENANASTENTIVEALPFMSLEETIAFHEKVERDYRARIEAGLECREFWFTLDQLMYIRSGLERIIDYRPHLYLTDSQIHDVKILEEGIEELLMYGDDVWLPVSLGPCQAVTMARGAAIEWEFRRRYGLSVDLGDKIASILMDNVIPSNGGLGWRWRTKI